MPALLHVLPVLDHLKVLPLRAHQTPEELVFQLLQELRLLLRDVVGGALQVLPMF